MKDSTAKIAECEVSSRDDNGFAKSFPQKLMELLSREDISNFIAWTPKGDAFVIKNESLFVEKVLRKFYKKTKYSSFRGKLYRWGFKRVMKGECAGAYYHRLFLRDDPKLCLHMRRKVGSSAGLKDPIESVNIVTPDSRRISKLTHDVSSYPILNFSAKKSRIETLFNSTLPSTLPSLHLPSLNSQTLGSESSNGLDQICYPLLRDRLTRELLLENATIKAQLQAQSLQKHLEINHMEKNYLESIMKILTQNPAYLQSSISLPQAHEGNLNIIPSLMSEPLSHLSKPDKVCDEQCMSALAGLMSMRNSEK